MKINPGSIFPFIMALLFVLAFHLRAEDAVPDPGNLLQTVPHDDRADTDTKSRHLASEALDSSDTLATAQGQKKKDVWKISKRSKFQLGYFRTQEEEARLRKLSSIQWLTVPASLPGPVGKPDGTVPLKVALARGFSFPLGGDAPENLNYLLKFFSYPADLNPHLSASRLLQDFLLTETSHGQELSSFVKSPENLYVKVGTLRKVNEDFDKNPLPPFQIPNSGKNNQISPQDYLDSGMNYATLFIESEAVGKHLPESKRIERSTDGIEAFHRELIALYSKSFVSEASSEPDQLLFLERHPCVENVTSVCRVTLYRIPREVPFFDNVKQRPRPEDPQLFLRSLFTVQRTDYFAPNSSSQNNVLNPSVIPSTWSRGLTKILEVGATVPLSLNH